ncbi:mce related protein [Ferrigenium kumadai]|uniref:Mce related protein n=1 Tax=Ferrigenium kumadai TaxID=1682490 RepID=A0AAN1SXY3_9PROT|nr:MlaD family protein [Ferrigenium kumadai]BBI98922.1 mce related protein [Ferrigenium kumadai]
MTLLADKDKRFKNLFGRAAIFLVLAVSGIALTFVMAGVKKGVFTPKSSVYFVADSGQDLSEGMPVKLSGFKVGTVKDLSLDEVGRVQVEAAIEQKYLPLIKEDAVARLTKGGLIGGDVILEISRGSERKNALAPGGTIRFERTGGVEDVALELRDRLLPILGDLHQMLNDPEGDVRQTLKNLREFSVEVRATRNRLDSLLEQADAGVTGEVVPMLRSLRQTSMRAESMATQLEQSLPVLVRKADDTLDNLKQTSETIRSAVEQSAPELPGLIGETHDIVEGVSTSWPVKNMMPVPESGPVKMDSHD